MDTTELLRVLRKPGTSDHQPSGLPPHWLPRPPAPKVLLAILLLAGCSTAPTEREIIAAHELVGFDWCSPAQLHQCPMIRQGNELFLLQPGERIGDGTSLGGDTYDFIGVTVDAFSEDE